MGGVAAIQDQRQLHVDVRRAEPQQSDAQVLRREYRSAARVLQERPAVLRGGHRQVLKRVRLATEPIPGRWRGSMLLRFFLPRSSLVSALGAWSGIAAPALVAVLLAGCAGQLEGQSREARAAATRFVYSPYKHVPIALDPGARALSTAAGGAPTRIVVGGRSTLPAGV